MAAVTALVPETEKPTERGPGLRAVGQARRVTRALLMVPFALFFAVPLLALVEFSTRATDLYGERTLEAWRAIGDNPELLTALRDSLLLALLTSVVALALLVPTMVWVRLRLPKLQRVVEFLCLLPLTIPALVLVVGLGPIYLWIAYFTPDAYDSSPLVLVFVYVVLVMPYMYRSLDAGLQAIDVRTLSEAARSLGAGWFTVMVRVILPNITSAVLNASLLAVAWCSVSSPWPRCSTTTTCRWRSTCRPRPVSGWRSRCPRRPGVRVRPAVRAVLRRPPPLNR